MAGEARTVAEGTKVISFPVRILDVVRGPGGKGSLILLRAEGPLVKRLGGIASGMSGSPVFIGGRLAGAIGYGWDFSDHNLGMATPIGEMGKIFSHPERISSGPSRPESGEGADSGDMSGMEGEERESDDPDPTDSGETGPCSDDSALSADAASGPLLVSGLSPRGMEAVGRSLGVPVRAGGGASSFAGTGGSVLPGAAVGVLLAWGDVEIGALGTLTATDREGRFVAFGHPFLSRGALTLPLAEAKIHAVVPSLKAPFKLGSFGTLIGTVFQDRSQGIGGQLGVLPPASDVRVSLLDADEKRSANRSFRVARDPYLLEKLVPEASLGVLDEMWGRVGPGTARVTVRFSGNDLDWTRTNTFFSAKDAMKDALKELGELTGLLSHNQFRDLNPLGIQIALEVTENPRILYIEDVRVDEKRTYAPGEEVSLKIRLRPWRGKPQLRTTTLKVPESAAGAVELLVRGGGIDEPDQDSLAEGSRVITSLKSLLEELGAKEANQDLVVELRGDEGVKGGKGDREEKDLSVRDRLAGEIRESKLKEGSMRIFSTNWYVEGLLRKVLKVRDGEGADPPGGKGLPGGSSGGTSSRKIPSKAPGGGDAFPSQEPQE
jgi:hypothetical protein